MNTRNSLAAIIVIAVLCLTWTVKSEGYAPNGKKWPPASVIYDYHTLSSSWKSATAYGSGRWNISGSLFEWAPSSSGDNDVYLDSIDGAGNVVGATSTWPQNACGTITRMTLRFDTGEKWYLDSGTPGSSYMDARSVAAHEFGHGLGLAHTQSSRCTGSESTKPTMCSSYPSGKTYFRTLEQDDKNGVTFLYSRLRSTVACSSVGVATPSVDLLYEAISWGKAVRDAKQIVRGIVTEVSGTMWNQDGGEYWEEESLDGTTLFSALPFHTVRIDPLETLLPNSQDGNLRPITLTILGESPLSLREGGGSPFEVGREVVVFAKGGRIAWRGGMKGVVQLVGSPGEAVLIQDKDGLFYTPATWENTSLELEVLRKDIVRLRTVHEN